MSIDPRSLRVAVLAGGTSGERDISLASGEGALEALQEAGFSASMLDPALPDDLKTLLDGGFDVAFLCMHGKYGEDGTLQGLLEIFGLPYTGPGVWSSATAMDKPKAKVFYERASIPTPPSAILTSIDNAEEQAHAFVQQAGFPLVVKPATEGSALGVRIVSDESELMDAVEDAFSIDSEILVERYIEGTEITVAVLGNTELDVLPVIEIVPCNDFYDFEAKYAPGGSQHICPATLPAAQTERAQELAVAAHRVLDCRGMSRTDMIVEKDGRIWVLETNTIPGMTKTSLLPDAAQAAGISFPELCTRLIAYALEEK